jgi:hypothetical protein
MLKAQNLVDIGDSMQHIVHLPAVTSACQRHRDIKVAKIQNFRGLATHGILHILILNKGVLQVKYLTSWGYGYRSTMSFAAMNLTTVQWS